MSESREFGPEEREGSERNPEKLNATTVEICCLTKETRGPHGLTSDLVCESCALQLRPESLPLKYSQQLLPFQNSYMISRRRSD